MPHTIDHFIWGYQAHFCITQEVTAKNIFERIDGRFQPQIFLVAVLSEKDPSKYSACVEPEKDFWIKSEDFDTILDRAAKLEKSYPERKMMHSHPIAQKSHDEHLKRRSIKDAINQLIEARTDKPENLVFFPSYPGLINSYYVSIVLGLQASVLDSYPSLRKTQVPMHAYRFMQVPKSFLDAVITTYLDKASEELRQPEPGSSMSGMNSDEILRAAANTLLKTLAYRADQHIMAGWHTIFNACNTIASTFYETSIGKGELLIAKKNHPSIRYALEFSKPSRLDSSRGPRKLLQLASQGLALHTDSENIFGLAQINSYDDSKEDLFKVRFLDHHHWQVEHASHVLMKVKYGQPYLQQPPFNKEKLRKDLARIFNKITKTQIERIVKLVTTASKEKHGTMLLITRNAKDETARLSSQGTPIKPKPLTPDLLRNLTTIDGAVILSPAGTCYAIGTILDGMATKAGNPSRGARYNSAIRYVHTQMNPSLAIVISEDGGVDIIPNLKPAIQKAQIEKAISALQHMTSNTLINRKEYNKTMTWLEEHEFYLQASHCDEINRLWPIIDAIILKEDHGAIQIVRNVLKPNPAMKPELFYE